MNETLLYTCKLKCPALGYKDRIDRVDQTMKDLELSHVAHVKVGGDGQEGGLSGGQKRRLSIAIELVTFPGILMNPILVGLVLSELS